MSIEKKPFCVIELAIIACTLDTLADLSYTHNAARTWVSQLVAAQDEIDVSGK